MTHDKEAEMRYRSGYYNACDDRGWQKLIERLHVTFVGHEYSARWERDAEDLADACRRIIFLP